MGGGHLTSCRKHWSSLNLKICAFAKELLDRMMHMALLECFNNLGNKLALAL
jgi:hypothetical protein